MNWTAVCVAVLASAITSGRAAATEPHQRVEPLQKLLAGLPARTSDSRVVLPPPQFQDGTQPQVLDANPQEKNSTNAWETAANMIEKAIQQMDWDAAEKGLSELAKGPNRSATCRGYEFYLYGLVSTGRNDTGAALKCFQNSLACINQEPLEDRDPLLVAMIFRAAADVYTQKGEPEGTGYYLTLALETLEKSSPPHTVEAIKAMTALTNFYLHNDRIDEVLPMVQRAEQIVRFVPPESRAPALAAVEEMIGALPAKFQESIRARRNAEKQYKDWADSPIPVDPK